MKKRFFKVLFLFVLLSAVCTLYLGLQIGKQQVAEKLSDDFEQEQTVEVNKQSPLLIPPIIVAKFLLGAQ